MGKGHEQAVYQRNRNIQEKYKKMFHLRSNKVNPNQLITDVIWKIGKG